MQRNWPSIVWDVQFVIEKLGREDDLLLIVEDNLPDFSLVGDNDRNIDTEEKPEYQKSNCCYATIPYLHSL